MSMRSARARLIWRLYKAMNWERVVPHVVKPRAKGMYEMVSLTLPALESVLERLESQAREADAYQRGRKESREDCAKDNAHAAQA